MKLIHVFLLFLVDVPLTLWSGFVASTLWGWFIVSAFNLPRITALQAIGISLVVKYLVHKEIDSVDERDTRDMIIGKLADAIVYPTVTLTFGWIVHLFY